MAEKVKKFIRYSGFLFLIGLIIMLILMWFDVAGGWIVYFGLVWLVIGILMMMSMLGYTMYTVIFRWDNLQKKRLIRFAYTFFIMLGLGIATDIVREGSWVNYSRAVTLAGGSAFGAAFYDLFSVKRSDFD